MRTEQAFVYRAGLLTKVPVDSLTVDERAEFEGIPAPRCSGMSRSPDAKSLRHGPYHDHSDEVARTICHHTLVEMPDAEVIE